MIQEIDLIMDGSMTEQEFIESNNLKYVRNSMYGKNWFTSVWIDDKITIIFSRMNVWKSDDLSGESFWRANRILRWLV